MMNVPSVRETPEGWSGSKRRRTRRACDVCRRAKVKCNGVHPCEHCVTFEYVCEYTEKAKSSSTPGTLSQPAGVDIGPSVNRAISLTEDAHKDDYIPSVPRAEGANGQEGVRQVSEAVADDSETEAFDYSKPRFVSSSSLIAFPRSLGQALDSQSTPRLHSFGYNLGVRSEEPSAIRTDLRQMTSNDDLRRYSDTCFSVLSPIFDILKPDYFQRRVQEHFHRFAQEGLNLYRQDHFGAVVAGVIALGSLFSLSAGHPRETELVEHAKRILDDPAAIRRPSIDLVIGWILRTIYLRATTRPNNAWLASCIAMNLAEATGLHSEDSIRSLSSNRAAHRPGNPESQAEYLRQVFWTAWSVHNITAFEYGRSCTAPLEITCAEREGGQKKTSGANLYFQLARIVQLLSKPLGPTAYKQAQDLASEGFSALSAISGTVPFIALTKADLCFCFYRRLRQQRFNMSATLIAQIIGMGNNGLDAALQLVGEQLPWWNVLNTTFQYLCVLLAIDTSASAKHVVRAYRTLENVAERFDTHMTREAVTTGRKLVNASIMKKREEIALMDAINPPDRRSNQSLALDIDLLGEGNLDAGIGWDGVFGDWYNEELLSYPMDFGTTT